MKLTTIIAGFMCYFTHTAASFHPNKSTVLVGDLAILRCIPSVHGTTVDLKHKPVGSREETHFYNTNFGIDNDHSGIYSVSTRNGTIELIINVTNSSIAGTYYCSDFALTEEAEVFVIESLPVCSSNISDLSSGNDSDCGGQSHFIVFSCRVQYAGNTPPRLTIQRVTGDDIVDITNSTGTTSGNLITAEVLLQINSSWNGSYLVCWVSATDAPYSSADQSIRRNADIRSLKFRCQSNEIHIPCVHSHDINNPDSRLSTVWIVLISVLVVLLIVMALIVCIRFVLFKNRPEKGTSAELENLKKNDVTKTEETSDTVHSISSGANDPPNISPANPTVENKGITDQQINSGSNSTDENGGTADHHINQINSGAQSSNENKGNTDPQIISGAHSTGENRRATAPPNDSSTISKRENNCEAEMRSLLMNLANRPDWSSLNVNVVTEYNKPPGKPATKKMVITVMNSESLDSGSEQVGSTLPVVSEENATTINDSSNRASITSNRNEDKITHFFIISTTARSAKTDIITKVFQNAQNKQIPDDQGCRVYIKSMTRNELNKNVTTLFETVKHKSEKIVIVFNASGSPEGLTFVNDSPYKLDDILNLISEKYTSAFENTGMPKHVTVAFACSYGHCYTAKQYKHPMNVLQLTDNSCPVLELDLDWILLQSHRRRDRLPTV